MTASYFICTNLRALTTVDTKPYCEPKDRDMIPGANSPSIEDMHTLGLLERIRRQCFPNERAGPKEQT